MITEDERRGSVQLHFSALAIRVFRPENREEKRKRVLPSFLLPSAFRNRCVRGGPTERTYRRQGRTAVLDSFAAVGAEAEGGRGSIEQLLAIRARLPSSSSRKRGHLSPSHTDRESWWMNFEKIDVNFLEYANMNMSDDESAPFFCNFIFLFFFSSPRSRSMSCVRSWRRRTR